MYSALFITAILAAALALVAWVLAPLTRAGLGDYHAVADFLLLLLAYGLLSALTTGACTSRQVPRRSVPPRRHSFPNGMGQRL